MSFFQDLHGSLFGEPTKVKETQAQRDLAIPMQRGELRPQSGLQMDSSTVNALHGLARVQRDGTKRNDGTVVAGKEGADMWQGVHQNLPGFRNMTNKANLGAELGAAHSVMETRGQAQGLAERQGRIGAYAEQGAKADRLASAVSQHNMGIANQADLHQASQTNQRQMALAEMSAKRAEHDAKLKEAARAAALSATTNFIGGAIKGYTAGKQFGEGWDQFKDEFKDSSLGRGLAKVKARRQQPVVDDLHERLNKAPWMAWGN